jgi:heat shock protein HtpX
MMLFAMLAILMVIASYIFIVALAAACVYFPYQLAFSGSGSGSQPILLLVFGVIIAGGLLWSLVPRPDKFTPPGPQLNRSQQPRLFSELDAIAASLNEPLPSEVYLIGDVNAWVADRGGILGVGSRRVMGLGLPLMSVLTVSQFRAVLAHEFAHYYGGDTSLGPWVYKTKMAMIRTFQTVGSLGALARNAILAIMHLVVSAILKGYFIVFLRAINLVSRKQEFRADELACLVAGPRPLIDGLRTIHGAGPAWAPYWNTEVVPLLNSGRMPALGEGFSRFLAAPTISQVVAANIQKEIREGKTSPYDSHPPLRERIAAAEQLPPASLPEDTRPANCLLDQPVGAEMNFIQALNPDFPAGSLRCVQWDEVSSEVTVPSWRKIASEHANTFGSVTAESLPNVIAKLADIGSKLADPKGMLLSPAQRMHRAGQLLAAGLALALLDDGWDLHVQPGVFHFQRGTDTFTPFAAVEELMQGRLSRASWLARCRELGLSRLELFSQRRVGVELETDRA